MLPEGQGVGVCRGKDVYPGTAGTDCGRWSTLLSGPGIFHIEQENFPFWHDIGGNYQYLGIGGQILDFDVESMAQGNGQQCI